MSLEYDSNVNRIKGIQFGILSPQEIRDRSVAEITTQETYTGNEPVVGGLFDPRMGVSEYGKICPTDGLDSRECPGYFGHIELARPVFHIQFLNIIQKLLRCVCIRCGQILVDKNNEKLLEILKKKGKQRWTEMISIAQKIKFCGSEREDGCGAKQPDKIQKEGVGKLYAEWKATSSGEEARKQNLTAEYVLKVLKRISNEDCEFLGFSRFWCRPDWMICQVLPVPPPAVRPSVKQDNNQRMEDDLTHKLVDIIKTNKTLQQKIESNAAPQVMDEWNTLLQYHIATLIDNEIPGVAPAQQRSGRPLKSIRQRLKSKEGRIRGNLMGKRVDFSARSVITPDPNISIDELGVPRHIAMNLTYPEVVTRFNRVILTRYARNGPDNYPGAKTIKVKSTGKMISLKHINRNTLVLNEGDIIDRHLIDGDVVLFNRQPSLHKMSMMGHRVRVMDYSTFRLNVSVTTPYNADFDGDEMNMHVPQSVQSKLELKYLTAVPYQIVSPRENKPIISIVQDTLLGTNRVTRDKVVIQIQQMMNMMMWNKNFDGHLPQPEKFKIGGWSGRQAMSMIIPHFTNLQMGNKSFDDDTDDSSSHNFIKIRDGRLIQGQLDKDIFTKTSRGLIHTVFNDYGPEEARKFLDNIQFIITQYLLDTGFSVGISDLIADRKTLGEIKDNILHQEKEAEEVIRHVHLGIFENLSGKSIQEDFETKMNGLMGRAVNKAGKIGLKSLSVENRMINMVKAGSKGNSINVGQMIACVGQQAVDGKRVPYGFTDRTLPHFTKYDDGPASRGFVENSFMSGLKPHEFFFHAMGGREGLIDTAVKTSETGYIQRKLMKAMEDLKVGYDLTVRNSSNSIVQFLYGEDGIESAKVESQMLPIGEINYTDFVKRYRFPSDETWDFITSEARDKMNANYKTEAVRLDEYFNRLLQDQKDYIEYCSCNPNNALFAPVHISRMINTVTSKFNLSTTQLSDLTPFDVFDIINKLFVDIRQQTPFDNPLFGIIVRHYLNPVVTLKKYRLTREAFTHLSSLILSRYLDSFVQPGEMVGAIAAQSIGEPATQMTLNTFHYAGVGEKSNVTRGVPRLKELLHISRNPKHPSLTVCLDEDIKYRQDKSQEIKNGLELTSLRDVVSQTKIYWDPSDLTTVVESDRFLLELYKEFQEIDPVCQDVDSPSNWVLRFEMDRKELLERQITMDDIVFSIQNIYQEDLSCIFSDDNSDELILRIRINKDSVDNEDEGIFLLRMLEKSMLDKIIIQGVNHINKVTMRTSKEQGFFSDGEFCRKDEWVLDTDGVNLLEVMNYPGVDPKRTTSNDIYEMNEFLGIEAARHSLFKEMFDVISFEGAYVNYRHLALLVETMTFKGGLMSVDRHGINRGDIGPLAKCSFEETTDQLLKAAIFGESDPVQGVSAKINAITYELDILGSYHNKVLAVQNDNRESTQFTFNSGASLLITTAAKKRHAGNPLSATALATVSAQGFNSVGPTLRRLYQLGYV